jgi:hypothetical protein
LKRKLANTVADAIDTLNGVPCDVASSNDHPIPLLVRMHVDSAAMISNNLHGDFEQFPRRNSCIYRAD